MRRRSGRSRRFGLSAERLPHQRCRRGCRGDRSGAPGGSLGGPDRRRTRAQHAELRGQRLACTAASPEPAGGKAAVAVVHTMFVIIWHVLAATTSYTELGDYYTRGDDPDLRQETLRSPTQRARLRRRRDPCRPRPAMAGQSPSWTCIPSLPPAAQGRVSDQITVSVAGRS